MADQFMNDVWFGGIEGAGMMADVLSREELTVGKSLKEGAGRGQACRGYHREARDRLKNLIDPR